MSRTLTRRADTIVVETTAFRERCAARRLATRQDVIVVPNAVNAIFKRPSEWSSSSRPLQRRAEEVYLAYIARPYAHKNHAFLPQVRKAAERRGKSLRFVVTLRDAEWTAQTDEFKAACVNVGPLALSELPALYQSVDAVFFPSLLESFSAAPLEGMAMGRPVFASDRDFVRSIYGDVVIYIDPLDADAAAEVLVGALSDDGPMKEKAARARVVVDGWPDASDRAHAYVNLIDGRLRTLTSREVR